MSGQTDNNKDQEKNIEKKRLQVNNSTVTETYKSDKSSRQNKFKWLLAGFVILALITIRNGDYMLEKSEGSCTIDSECSWSEQGCGGGHGICTNDPDKYKNMFSTCEINPNFPTNLGYSCGCIETQSKCGWEKESILNIFILKIKIGLKYFFN